MKAEVGRSGGAVSTRAAPATHQAKREKCPDGGDNGYGAGHADPHRNLRQSEVFAVWAVGHS
jgi:hypothetical protein